MTAGRCGDLRKGLLKGEVPRRASWRESNTEDVEIRDGLQEPGPLQRGRRGSQWTIQDDDCFR